MNQSKSSVNGSLDVRPSKLIAALATFALSFSALVALGFLALFLLYADCSRASILLQLAIFVALGSIGALSLFMAYGFGRLLVRKEPLFRLDDEGITDFGISTSGYGLIKWHQIESIAQLADRNGKWLFLKVRNYDDLLARRHFLLRPILGLAAATYGMLGAEIYLPVPFSTENIEDIKMLLARRGYRDIVDLTPKFMMFTLFVVVVIALAMGLLFSLYRKTLLGPS